MKYTTKTRGGGGRHPDVSMHGAWPNTHSTRDTGSTLYGVGIVDPTLQESGQELGTVVARPKTTDRKTKTANRVAVNPKVFRQMKEGPGQKPCRAYRLQPLGFEVMQARRLGRTPQ